MMIDGLISLIRLVSFFCMFVFIVRAISALNKGKDAKPHAIALATCFCLLIVCGIISPAKTSNAEKTEREYVAVTEESSEQKMEDKPRGDHYDESLKGRGHSDSGRNEPDYVNVVGYVAVGYDESYELERSDQFRDESLWTAPTFEQDKQFWVQNGTLPHKTEVVVREQILHHEGYGAYSGYLLVEKTDDKSQYYINVTNFITKPYWTYQSDLRNAALTGDFVAEFNQTSDYYPVDRGGEKVEIQDGTVVLVKGVTGLSGDINEDENDIEAIVWKDWRYGYGGVDCYFNRDDLTILY